MWRNMVAVATQAQAEAISRKKKFVLYFATDFEEFRPLVTRLLSNITTPLFGLRSEEIGHIVYGRWRPAPSCTRAALSQHVLSQLRSSGL